jgi:hypothetical protein
LKNKEPDRFATMKKDLMTHNAAVVKEGPDWWTRLSADGARPPKKEGK